jgi:hypothetical protein
MGLVKKYALQYYYRLLVADFTSTLSYPQLVGARVCLGVAEAGLFP